jgi:S1-C subfamily serine protease
VGEIDRWGYREFPPGGYRPPPGRRRPLRGLAALLIVILVSVVSVRVGRAVWQAASTLLLLSPPWSSSAVLPPAGTGRSSGAVPASGVAPALVDINTQLGFQNAEGAGTGIVLSASGEVLTNNHVISGATSMSVTDVGNGQTYRATVVGYDLRHDIAVLQLQGAAGLQTAPIGDSGTVAVGDEITAIGNAGGFGGTPSAAAGTVSALDQAIHVTDNNGGNVEELSGLIEVAANVAPGDSGGPLVNNAGQVVGVTTAGSSGSRFQSSGSEGFAIPINDALAIRNQINAGAASSSIHIGPTGTLGIVIQEPDAQARLGWSGSRYRSAGRGVVVAGVTPGSPAERSGLAAGDVIVSLDTAPVDSPATLTTLLSGHHPGDLVRLAWVDPAGQPQDTTVRLASGPPR